MFPRIRRKAFTMVELIVVVVILGVLALIAVPTYHMVITRTQDRAAEASLTSLAREVQSLSALRGDGVFTPADFTAAAADMRTMAAAPGVSAAPLEVVLSSTGQAARTDSQTTLSYALSGTQMVGGLATEAGLAAVSASGNCVGVHLSAAKVTLVEMPAGASFCNGATARDMLATSSAPSAAPSGVTPVARSYALNFQPADAPVPAGFTAESGAPWSDAAGMGWVREDSLSSAVHVPADLGVNTRLRPQTGVAMELRTLIHTQYGTITSAPGSNYTLTAGAFEVAVPDGKYKVAVSVGDPEAVNSDHTVRAEGLTVINRFRPVNGNMFQSAEATVTVTDGRLTVDTLGGFNTKLNWLKVTPVS